jgi:hypothetical protein
MFGDGLLQSEDLSRLGSNTLITMVLPVTACRLRLDYCIFQDSWGNPLDRTSCSIRVPSILN